MILSITKQFYLIMFSLIAGIMTGVFFDYYRLIRGFNNLNKVITLIEDILFWIFSAIVVFIFLLITNCAYIGIYVYMWMVIGIYIYIKLLSKIFIRSQYKLIRLLGRIFRIMRNILIYPFQLVFYLIKSKNKKNL